jgi:hypothetical protein
MFAQELPLPIDSWVGGQATRRLHQEFRGLMELFQAQPKPIQFFLVSQAQSVADALLRRPTCIHFALPTLVICETGTAKLTLLPGRAREQIAGGFIDRFTARDLRTSLNNCLSRLERDPNQAVSTGSKLLRFTTAVHLIEGCLPSIESVSNTEDREDLDSPFFMESKSAAGFVVVGNCPTPIEPYIRIFRDVVALAPYVVASKGFQQKRYRLLGPWIKQNRELAQYETMEIIHALRRLGKDLTLQRGLRISLPYFDDQELALKLYEVNVIPACRIGFDPGFVAAAALSECEKIAQDDHFSPTTRNHLLNQLRLLETSLN